MAARITAIEIKAPLKKRKEEKGEKERGRRERKEGGRRRVKSGESGCD